MLNRRNFFKTTGLATLASAVNPVLGMARPDKDPELPLLKPAVLRVGATIGLITPSSPPLDERFDRAVEILNGLGFKVKVGKNVRARYGYLAGTDKQRIDDLHEAFRDPEVEAVWCLRGGYGAGRLLPYLDYDLIRRNPKPLIGYSDITALHLAIHKKTGLVSFHGPVAGSDFPENTLRHFTAVAMRPEMPYTLSIPPKDVELPGPEFLPFVISEGIAEGVLTGGNLSLLSAMVGTEYLPSFRGKIVFIEDIGEQPYRIDRMFVQLMQGSDLADAAGIALGVFSDCQPKGNSPSLSLVQTLKECLGNMGMPVVYGLPFGHVAHNATLPMGIKAALDAGKGTLTLLERAVV
jgi:muramoyltetrapeptide carboxypeptidase